MKKLLLVGLLLAAMATFVAAGGQQEEGGETAADGDVTVSFWAPVPNDTFRNYYRDAARRFTEMDNGITVEYRALPESVGEVDTELNAAQLAGNYPDVFVAYIIFMGTRGTQGDFMDLSEFIEEWDGRDELADPAFDLGLVNGKQLGLAFFPGPYVFSYRRDHFEQAGLDPNRPPRTWEELKEYAERLVVRDDNGVVTRSGFDIPAIADGVIPLIPIRQGGGTVVGPDGLPYLDNPDNGAGLEFYRDMIESDLTIPHDFRQRSQWPFIRGAGSMALAPVANVRAMVEAEPSLADNIGFARPFAMDGNSTPNTFAGNRLFTIGADSRNKEESWEFVEYMFTRVEVAERMKLGIAPPREDLYDEFVAQGSTDFERRLNRGTLEAFQFGQGFPATSWFGIARGHLTTAYEDIYHGRKGVMEALQDAQEATLREID